MEYETPQFYRVTEYARQADRDVVDMVSGSPDWDPPEPLRAGLREYADADPADFQYPPSEGLRPLREEIAARRGVAAGQVLLTHGTAEANHLAMAGALDAHGDEVLLVDPVYPYYAGRASLLGADATFVPVDDGHPHPDPDRVREAASDDTAAIVITTPNNPLGVTYDAETVTALVSVAEACDAVLISDEVYDHFDYSGEFASALSVDSAHRVVTNAFSKSMAVTGFRVGYAVFPDPAGPGGHLVDRARTRHMLTTVTGSRPAQAAVLAALRETGPEYYEATRDRLRRRIGVLTDALADVGAEYTEPEGAFYVMARLPGFGGTFDHAERLIDEAGVAGMPGVAFGEARADWLRFSLTTDRVETAAERLVAFL